jgi:hypothetical protein
MSANSELEAPMPTEYGLMTELNRLPPMPPNMISIKYLYHLPIAFSMENPIIRKERRFQKRCPKLECKIIGSKSL